MIQLLHIRECNPIIITFLARYVGWLSIKGYTLPTLLRGTNGAQEAYITP